MASKTSNPTGDAGYWSDANTWSPNGVPIPHQTVKIAAGDTVYFDLASSDDIGNIEIETGAALRFVTATTPAGNLNGHAPSSRTALVLDCIGIISGNGALYVGNSDSDRIARPAAAVTYVPNAKIYFNREGTIYTTGITVETQHYYGWVPNAPAEHPSYTKITGSDINDSSPPLAGETKIRVEDSNFDVRQGDQIVIGVGGTAGHITETTSCIYTVSSFASSVITLTANLGTNRVIGDKIAIYTRPILISSLVSYPWSINSASDMIMEGVRQIGQQWNNVGTNNQYKGCTVDGGGMDRPLQTHGSAIFTDCVAYNNYSLAKAGANHGLLNCIAINSEATIGALLSGSYGWLYNCVAQNCYSGLLYNAAVPKVFNSTARANVCGLGNLSSADFINCIEEASTYLFANGRGSRLYDCTIEQTTVYSLSSKPLVGFNLNGATNYYAWTNGGVINTQNSIQYQSLPTLKFASSSNSLPMIWDTEIFVIGGEAITVTIPMYREAGDTGVVAEVWVFDPKNDPLALDDKWLLTPSIGITEESPTATYVLARTPMPDVTGSWQAVDITIPAQATSRRLVLRVIGKAPTGKNCYAYMTLAEDNLMLAPHAAGRGLIIPLCE
jgi:hypothetical protein